MGQVEVLISLLPQSTIIPERVVALLYKYLTSDTVLQFLSFNMTNLHTRERNCFPIASLFNCCCELLSRFTQEYESLPAQAGFPESSDLERCKDQLAQLKDWDDRRNVSCGELDHISRYNKKFNESVLKVLVELKDALDVGK
jgi:hypothetical protein